MALSLTYWILAAYLVLGSASLGYLFLRTGWPKVRSLEAPYKIGWSIMLGLVFAVFSVAGALAIDAFFPTGLGSGELLLIIAAASFTAILPMLTIRRKFFAAKKARVHVPKEIVGAKLVAAKAVDKLMFDRAFIDSSGLQLGKINELRKALERKRAEAAAAAVPAAAPEKKSMEAKPTVAPSEKQAEAPDWMKDEGKAQEKPAPVVPKPQFLRTAFEQKISEATKKTAEEEAKAGEDEKKKKDAEAAKIIAAKIKEEPKTSGTEAVEKKPELQKKPVGQQKPAAAAAMPAAKAAAEEKNKPEQAPAARDFAQRQNAPIFAAAKIGKPIKKEGEIEIGWGASGAAEGKEKSAGAQKAALSEEEKKKKIQELKETIRKAKEAK